MSRRSLLVCAGAGLAVPGRAGAQTLTKLTVGTGPIDDSTPVLAGVHAGIYRRYGLDVDVQQFQSGAAMAAAVVGGSLQIGGSAIMGLILAHLRNVPFRIVTPGSVYLSEKPAMALLVRKDSPIHSAADLNGKTIASPALHDLFSAATLAWMEANGGDASSVRQVEVPPAATLPAIEAGRIDAAMIVEPRLSEGLRSGNVRVLGKAYDAIGKRFLVAAEFSTLDFINANRELVGRFTRAQLEAHAYANAHPAETAPWLAEFAKVDVDTIRASTREVFAESLSLPDIQRVIDAAVKYKLIDRGFDAREIVSPLLL